MWFNLTNFLGDFCPDKLLSVKGLKCILTVIFCDQNVSLKRTFIAVNFSQHQSGFNLFRLSESNTTAVKTCSSALLR